MRDILFWNGFVSGLLVVTLMAWGLGIWKDGREKSSEATCSSGLLEIRPLLWDYVQQHQGKFPLSLKELDWQKASPDAKAGCPKVKGKFPRGEGWRGYLYIPPRDDAPDDTPILLCWRHRVLMALTKGGELKKWDK